VFRTALHDKAKGSPSFRFYALYDKVYRKDGKDVLAFAYECCKANGGAAGVDGQTDIEAYGEERWLDELAQELKNRSYESPSPALLSRTGYSPLCKARPGPNSFSGSQAPVRSQTSGPHASAQHTANASRFHQSLWRWAPCRTHSIYRDVSPTTNLSLQALFLLWATNQTCRHKVWGRQSIVGPPNAATSVAKVNP
jgi:hypothetical protein